MFCWMDDLLFGKADILWERPAGSEEIHVDRTMNVWGSGGAHATYFNKIDEIVIDIFNQDIEKQPKGIADMGCGNGALLQHLYELVKNKTKRGRMLEEYPLLIVGSDFNDAALVASRKTLTTANIEAHFLKGDIGQPAYLAKDLDDKFNVDLGQMLNVRSFLDHNRIFEDPKDGIGNRKVTGTGAYAFCGKRIPNNVLEQNLFEHLAKWKPYINKFGLLVIELHTIPPRIAAENIGKTAITAYDGTHGFTDQFIVELDVFLNIAEELGLHSDSRCHEKYPPNELATVSINLFKEKTK